MKKAALCSPPMAVLEWISHLFGLASAVSQFSAPRYICNVFTVKALTLAEDHLVIESNRNCKAPSILQQPIGNEHSVWSVGHKTRLTWEAKGVRLEMYGVEAHFLTDIMNVISCSSVALAAGPTFLCDVVMENRITSKGCPLHAGISPTNTEIQKPHHLLDT